MSSLLLAPAVFLFGAVACLGTVGRPWLARRVGPAVTVAGAFLGLIPVVAALAGGSVTVCLPWTLPLGALSLEMDALSAVFAAPILLVTALAAVYGAGYLRPLESSRELALSWCFYNLLAGSMLLVVEARNAMLFLMAWELMALSSFFLVMFDGRQAPVRQAGWTYLVASHLGTAFLLLMFALLAQHGATPDFAGFQAAILAKPGLASVVFVLALIGFGAKAGFVPLHVWLPDAHPAAPSHVSAVMSGVMIKTGIYGLVRVLTFLGPPPAWWGWTLVVVGVTSGVIGVLFALAQQDLKRLLAYSSVENVGLVAIGLGVGLLGVRYGCAGMALLGFAGALLHVINHAVFKSLLFLGAGSVLHATGTRDLDHLGGLLKPMPVTGVAFLIGSAAICGLPPFNGFVSEFMIFAGVMSAGPCGQGAVMPVVMGALALIGGLALACFTRAFGVVFLGEPRRAPAVPVHACGPAMRWPMLGLAALCVLIGLSGPLCLRLLLPACAAVWPGVGGAAAGDVSVWLRALGMVTAGVCVMLALAGLVAGVRLRLLRGKSVARAVTWDCGYAAPTARMQYTAASYAEPLAVLFHSVLRTRVRATPPPDLFPATAAYASTTPDGCREYLFAPIFRNAERGLHRLHWLQHGRLNLYILCIVLALLALLGWKVR